MDFQPTAGNSLCPSSIQTDYLVVGAGASAMAFVDVLLAESDARVVMVDRHDQAGGHWNTAYPFVRLHQSAAFYGVCSREFGDDAVDTDGLNQGFHKLVSRNQILDYYDQVMRQRFLSSGRVHFLPVSEHVTGPDGGHRVRSLLTGVETEILVRRKFVDATHAQTETPATHRPRYGVAEGVDLVPVNQLPHPRRSYRYYTVVGSGKTGMDACLWLLDRGVEPERLRWIMPRDAWVHDRATIQPFVRNFDRTADNIASLFQSILDAATTTQLFELLEERGILMRIDPAVEPGVYRCAQLSRLELEELRRIKDVVRHGRVTTIEPDRIMLENGAVHADPDTLYVDCSAAGTRVLPDIPAFDGRTINLVMIRYCQPLFSTAMIAYVESRYSDEMLKNTLCQQVTTPRVPLDWLRTWQQTLRNDAEWQKHPSLMQWISRCRLHSLTAAQAGMASDDPRRRPQLERLAAKAAAAAAKLPILLEQR